MNNSDEKHNDRKPLQLPPVSKPGESHKKLDKMNKFDSPLWERPRDLTSMEKGMDWRSPPGGFNGPVPEEDFGYLRNQRNLYDGRDRMANRNIDWTKNDFERRRMVETRRRRELVRERSLNWARKSFRNQPLTLEPEFKDEFDMRRQQFPFERASYGRNRHSTVDPVTRHYRLERDLLERELETAMWEDRRRHVMELERNRLPLSSYGMPYEENELPKNGKRNRMWQEGPEYNDRLGRNSLSKASFVGDSNRDFLEPARDLHGKLPSIEEYEEMLRQRERLLQSQRQNDLEIIRYREQLDVYSSRNRRSNELVTQQPSFMVGNSNSNRELLNRRPLGRSYGHEIPQLKMKAPMKAKSFLSSSDLHRPLEKPIEENREEDSRKVAGFKKIKAESPRKQKTDKEDSRIKINFFQNEETKEKEEKPAEGFSRIQIKIRNDKAKMVRETPIPLNNRMESFGNENQSNTDSQVSIVNEKETTGEFKLKIARKSGAVLLKKSSENDPMLANISKPVLATPKRTNFKRNEGELKRLFTDSKDQSTQTKENPVINFLGQHSLNKLSALLKKHNEINENQLLYMSRKRGKGRPHKNKENVAFHCLLNKDKETIITEELDNIISSFVICSLQDKQVSLKIKDFSFWMKNRLFEIQTSSDSFKPQHLTLRDLSKPFLQSLSTKLLQKRFDLKYASELVDFRAVFMLDFLIYNTIKTKLITETVSINFNTLNRLRNNQELTLPLVLASFVFLISNFLIQSKFEMFYCYCCFLFSQLFRRSISSCVLHLSGRSAQLEFSIQKLVVSSQNAAKNIEEAYQVFIDKAATFSEENVKIFIETEKQLQFNSLLNHYIGIFAMLLQ